MKETDDTPLNKNESEAIEGRALLALAELAIRNDTLEQRNDTLESRIAELEIRVANLETQRTPQDENDDPEWY